MKTAEPIGPHDQQGWFMAGQTKILLKQIMIFENFGDQPLKSENCGF